MSGYAHPDVLVSTDWVAQHLQDPQVRIVEVDYDPSSAYELGHIPGAVLVDWKSTTPSAGTSSRRTPSRPSTAGLASAPKRRSSCTATTGTGSQPLPSGSTSYTAIPTSAS
jgi:3-mercaptopyruvate sulfurtransferase SseA